MAAVAADIMLFDNWFDAIEDGVRDRVRGFIGTMLEEELGAALSRPRYGRRKATGNEDAATRRVRRALKSVSPGQSART
jgi:putative transposase